MIKPNCIFTCAKVLICAALSIGLFSCNTGGAKDFNDSNISCVSDSKSDVMEDVSNGNNGQAGQQDQETEDSLEEVENESPSDIPISLNVETSHMGYYEVDVEFKGEYNKKGVFQITPFGNLLDIVSGKKETETRGCILDEDCINGLPILECVIVNDTNRPLNLTSIDFVVKSSSIDQTPIVNAQGSGEDSNTLTFFNDSWINWGSATFEYSILRKEEKFNGNYENSIEIPYFEEKYTHDFLPDIVRKGLDLKSLDKVGGLEALSQAVWHEIAGNPDPDYSKIDININKVPGFEKVKYPFEFIEYCTPACSYVGKLTFANGHSEKLHGKIILWADGFGGDNCPYKKHDVLLKEKGKNYTVTYPYSAVIPKGCSDTIKILVDVEKSSNHSFHIVANNTNGHTIRSSDINLYLLKPRFGILTAGIEY